MPLVDSPFRAALRGVDVPGFRCAVGQSLTLDLRNVECVTAGGLGGLVALHAAIRKSGGRLSLRNVNPWPLEVLRLCRLDEVLDIRAENRML